MDDQSLEPLGERGFLRRHFPTLPRLFAYLLLLVCVIALLVVTAAVAFNIYGSAKLRDARARAAEVMAPLTRQGFRAKYIPVPDTENAALYYKAAFNLMRAGGRDELMELAKADEWPEYPEDLPLPPEYLGQLRAFVEQQHLALEILREARPLRKSDYDVEFDDMTVSLAYLSQARSNARLLAMAMYVASADGRTEDGIGYARDCIALSRSLSREPLLVQALVSIAIANIACSPPLTSVFAGGDAPDADLAALQEALLDYADEFMIRPALEGELVMTNAIFEGIRSGRMPAAELLDSRSHKLPVPRWLVAGYLKADQANAIEISLDLLQDIDRPPAEVTDRWEERGEALSESPWLLSKMLIPSMGRAVAAAERTRALMQATALAVAALRFRDQTGRWPETAGELAGDFIDAVPADPITGGPFVFTVLDDGLIVYSVGENGFDDAGKPYLVPTPENERYKYDDVGFRIRFPNLESAGDAAE